VVLGAVKMEHVIYKLGSISVLWVLSTCITWVSLKRVECRGGKRVGIMGGRVRFFAGCFRLARICGPGSPLVGWASVV